MSPTVIYKANVSLLSYIRGENNSECNGFVWFGSVNISLTIVVY